MFIILSMCLQVCLYFHQSFIIVWLHSQQSGYVSASLSLFTSPSTFAWSIGLSMCPLVCLHAQQFVDMTISVYISNKLCLHVQQSVESTVSWSICLPSCVYTSNSPSTLLSVGLYVYQAVSTCPTVCRHGYQSVYMSNKLCLQVQQSVDTAISRSICLPSCVTVYMSISLSTCSQVCLHA